MKIAFEKDNKNYEVIAENFSFDGKNFDYESITVKEDGEVMTSFGENFTRKFVEADVLESIILNYINNGTLVSYTDIPEELVSLKNELFKNKMSVKGRQIPETYYRYGFSLEKLSLQLVTDEIVAYVGLDTEGYALVDTETGELITNIEEFFTPAVAEAYKNGNVLYVAPETEAWIKEYQE